MNGRDWRVVKLDDEGAVIGEYGYMFLYPWLTVGAQQPTALAGVEREHGRWAISVGVRDDIGGMTAGSWTRTGPGELTHGVALYVPDADTLRSVIRDLVAALPEMETAHA